MLPAEAPGVFAEALDGIPDAAKQQPADDLGIELDRRIEDMWQGEVVSLS